MTDPAKARCWDKQWTYKRSDSNHHIRERFDRVREELRQQAQKASTVRPLRKKGQP